MEDAILALAGVILGGAGTKLVEKLFENKKQKQRLQAEHEISQHEELNKVRAELWLEINKLRKELEDVRGELDEWRDKYWALYAEHETLKVLIDKNH